MTDLASLDAYGVLTEPATLKIQRLLPGPIERIWAYLTESELRRKWLAAGETKLEVGAPVEFVWRNNELTDPRGQRASPTSIGCAAGSPSSIRRANSRSPGTAVATFRSNWTPGVTKCCSP